MDDEPAPPSRASEAQLWKWLDEVPDPEIPVISIVDLGIVRSIAWSGATLVVTVTPTYSGCPATRAIDDDIVAQLARHGVDEVRLERQLSPAWTSDWLTPSGRDKLLAYGIAPPVDTGSGCAVADAAGGVAVMRQVPSGTPAGVATPIAPVSRPPAGGPAVSCPRCGAGEAERISQFGSTPCKASYRCLECLEPFDYFKCI